MTLITRKDFNFINFFLFFGLFFQKLESGNDILCDTDIVKMLAFSGFPLVQLMSK